MQRDTVTVTNLCDLRIMYRCKVFDLGCVLACRHCKIFEGVNLKIDPDYSNI